MTKCTNKVSKLESLTFTATNAKETHLEEKCVCFSISVTFLKLFKVSKQILNGARFVARCFLEEKKQPNSYGQG